jgi:D-alanyl-lipoteichoic acid acyltransferase DltB (MBOAT superfamily)
LLAASYFFYACWDWRFVFLLAFSTVLDFYSGIKIYEHKKQSQRKLWLIISVGINLGFLGVFKYYNFFADSFAELLSNFGLKVHYSTLNIILPVGISFYTFHGLSYIIDIYYGRVKPERNFINYSVFVSFFPLLVAGPIERANHLLPQVQKRRVFNYVQALEGCRLILWGLFKKIAVADRVAVTVNEIFGHHEAYNAFSLITGAVLFSFQIYCDFSGYSDIATGTAKLFGFELLTNFKFPYFSRDLAEFWRRWHFSLSSWFRVYLYIPLGGSKAGKAKAIRNTFIIFLVSGFWHGASWNFISWGFIHACGFLPLLLLKSNRKHTTDIVAQNRMLPTLLELWQMVATFVFVTFAWVFFRADSMVAAVAYLRRILTDTLQHPTQYFHIPVGLTDFKYVLPLLIGDWWLRRNERSLKMPQFQNPLLSAALRIVIYWSVICALLWNLSSAESSFIYFQF